MAASGAPSEGWTGRIRRNGRKLMIAVFNRGGGRVSAVRGLAFRSLARFTPIVAVNGDGVQYLVSTADRAVGRATFISGGYEGDVMERIIALTEEATGRVPLLAGRTFVDVGANIGTTTIPALLRYGATDALAFEPAPDSFRLLECNLVLNGVSSRVQALQMALSDVTATATLELSDVWGDRRVRMDGHDRGEDALGEAAWPTTEVRTARFDDLAAELGVDLDRIGLVWIDTQGHEAHVLAGAPSVLERGVPVVAEYWPYGLRRAGGLDRLHTVAASAYRSFIDVRAPGSAMRPVSELPELAAAYPGPYDYTDLLLLA